MRFGFLLVSIMALGCGSIDDKIDCGDGTHEENGECVPDEESDEDDFDLEYEELTEDNESME